MTLALGTSQLPKHPLCGSCDQQNRGYCGEAGRAVTKALCDLVLEDRLEGSMTAGI